MDGGRIQSVKSETYFADHMSLFWLQLSQRVDGSFYIKRRAGQNMDRALLQKYRYFLKDTIRKTFDFSLTDQSRRIPAPPIEKPYQMEKKRIKFTEHRQIQAVNKTDLFHAIENRQSHRSYTMEPIPLNELSFLLWATQGIKQVLDPGHALRTVPSAGCRHALETYLCALNVEGLNQGIYRYLPLEHELLFEHAEENLKQTIVNAVFGQTCAGEAAITFIWTTIPYRMEWRYGLAAHKVIAIDAGHVCQNLYLACEAIGAGACAIAAYDQEKVDQLLGVDGQDEFAIYLAAVGKRGQE